MAEPSDILQPLFQDIEKERNLIVELLRDLVRTPTVNTGKMPTGFESEACRVLQKRFETADDIDTQIVESAESRGSFYARRASSVSNGKRLLFISHLDVVPAGDAARWTFPPFDAEIHEGRIYGRGAIDCKTLVAAEASAMLALSRHRIPLAGHLTFVAGADEETGGHYGFGFLAKNRPEWLKADLAINEGGGRPVKGPDGTQKYLLGIAEKGRYEVEFTIEGNSSHASIPWSADNPIAKSAELLRRLDAFQPEVDPSFPLFQRLGELVDLQDEINASNLDPVISQIESRDRSLANVLRALSRMTLVPTIIEGGEKSNSIPGRCRIVCDARLLPNQSREELERIIAQIGDGLDGVSTRIIETAGPSRNDFDEAHIDLFQRSLQSLLNDGVRCLPSCCTGFTDSRFIRSLGVPTYGFQVTHPDSDPRLGGIHCVNESASIEDVVFLTKTLCALAIHYLGLRR